MRNSLPGEWAGIEWNRELRVAIHGETGEELLVGKGAIIRCNAVVFLTDRGKARRGNVASIAVGSAPPLAVSRYYWPGEDRVSWVFEV